MPDNRPIVHGYIGSQSDFKVNPEGGVASSVPIGDGLMLIGHRRDHDSPGHEGGIHPIAA